MKLRLTQPGSDPILYESDADSITIGRAETCDLTLSTPFVSTRHLMLIRGLVAIDLGSTNGTFLDGERIEGPVALTHGQLCLGNENVLLEVLDLPESGAPAPVAPAPAPAAQGTALAEPSNLAGLQAALEQERLRAQAADSQRDQLTLEKLDLERRLDSLKAELEEGLEGGAAELSSKLAQAELKLLRDRNEALQRQLDGALAQSERGARVAAEVGGEAPAAGAAPAPMAMDMFLQLQRDNAELRTKVKELEAGPATGGMPPAPEIFFKLQQENAELKRRLEQVERAPAPGPLPMPMPPLQPQGGEQAPSSQATQLAPPVHNSPPAIQAIPAVPVERRRSEARSELESGLLEALAGPAKEVQAPARCPSTDFLTFENLRFVMNVERFVTRIAGDAIELLNPVTMLPGTEDNYRTRAAAVLHDPLDAHVRQDLSGYLGELSRWLIVSQRALQQSATRFAEELKGDLSEHKLGQRGGQSIKHIIPFRTEAELWRRTAEYMNELTPEMIDDRVQRITRDAVQQLMESHQSEM